MKDKFSLFILALSLLFFSCGGGLSQEGTGSVSIDAGKVAEYISRNAARAVEPSVYYKMTVKLSTIGDYEASAEGEYKKNTRDISRDDGSGVKSFYKSAMGTPVTINDIPVGSNIKVKAEVYFSQFTDIESFKAFLRETEREMSEDMIEAEAKKMEAENEKKILIGEGISDTFVVKSGSNNITVKLTGSEFGIVEDDEKGEDEVINIPIVLYELGYDGDNSKIFSYINDEKKYIAYGSDDDSLKFINYCIDGNGYMYVLYKKFDHDQLLIDCYYVYSNNPNFPEPTSSDAENGVMLPTDTQGWRAIAYDSVENTIYSYYKDNDSNLVIVNFPSLISTGNATECSKYTSSSFYIGDYIDGGIFAVNNNIAYVGRKESGNWGLESLNIFKFDLSNGEILGEGSFIIDLCSEHENLENVTDTYYYDGNLYILVTNKADTLKVSGVNGGGIIKINPVSKVTSEILFSENKDLTISGSDAVFSFPQPDSPEAKDSFFCPKKIIGIKPKKLIIADDGVFLYTDNENNPLYKNVNRVVTVDLDSFPIKITNVLPIDVNFEGDKREPLGIGTLYGENKSFTCDD